MTMFCCAVHSAQPSSFCSISLPAELKIVSDLIPQTPFNSYIDVTNGRLDVPGTGYIFGCKVSLWDSSEQLMPTGI